jgi:hypothetical protein
LAWRKGNRGGDAYGRDGGWQGDGERSFAINLAEARLHFDEGPATGGP